MPALRWAAIGERYYEAGVDRGVFYPNVGDGVAWSGLISVTESPTGGEARPFYMDGIKFQNRASNEEFVATLEAYTYPREFARCDGTLEVRTGLFAAHQRREAFGLSYRTRVGSDLDQDLGYKIHLIYNVLASPTERSNQTLRDTPEATTFSWSLTTTPTRVEGFKPTAHFIVDSREVRPAVLEAIEALLYGTVSSTPRLPPPIELLSIVSEAEPDAPFVVTDLGDGLFSISGSDEAVKLVDPNHFQLSSTYVIDHLDGTWTATTGVVDDPDGPPLPFTVEDLGSGLYKISGPDSMVHMTDANHFQLNSSFVTDNGDGSYTATSA